MNKEDGVWLLSIVLFIFMIMTVIFSVDNRLLRRNAIESGAAQYSPTTGNFEWLHEIEGGK